MTNQIGLESMKYVFDTTISEKEKMEKTVDTSSFSSSPKCFQIAFTQCDLNLTHYQTTNFTLFQTERVCRRLFQIYGKLQKVIQMGRKHCVFKRLVSQGHQKVSLCGNVLIVCPAISPFPTVFSKGLFPRGVKRNHCVGMG